MILIYLINFFLNIIYIVLIQVIVIQVIEKKVKIEKIVDLLVVVDKNQKASKKIYF